MSQAVQRNPAAERQRAVIEMAQSIGESIPTSLGALIKTDQIIKAACAQIADNDLLSQCSVSSIKRAVISAASQGLIPGFGGQGWFVPYKKGGSWECQWITGYQGKLAMLRREGSIVFAAAEVVYENDRFHMTLGFDQDIQHVPALQNRGAIRGAYFAARDKDGNKYAEYMPIEDLEKAREMAKRGDKESPAWRNWTDEMYRKTVTHRACKRLPLSPDLMRIFEAQLVAEGGFTVDIEPERPAIEMPRRKSAALPAPVVEDLPAETEAESSETTTAETETKAPEAETQQPATDGSLQGPRFKCSAGDVKFLTPYAEAKGKTVLEILEGWDDSKDALAKHVKKFYAEQKPAESNPQPAQGELIK